MSCVAPELKPILLDQLMSWFEEDERQEVCNKIGYLFSYTATEITSGYENYLSTKEDTTKAAHLLKIIKESRLENWHHIA